LDERTIEKNNFLTSLWFALGFTLLLYAIKGVESIFQLDFSDYGVLPLNLKGLRGVIFGPLIHGSWEHLYDNSIPLFILILALFYFYREISFKVFFLIYFVHGLWLWFFGRTAHHIGASGIVYGLAAFLFVSGIIRRNTHLLAISLLVVFLYGSMVWGIFPMIETVSWESHLTGTVAGIIFAFYYRQYGPPANFKDWKNDETDTMYELTEEEENPDYLEKLREEERKPEEK
jgi:membrane associated rhomboid family serine protease